jgi:8-oxo-dGTP pyrophosphatase MutT (NUDIX family)
MESKVMTVGTGALIYCSKTHRFLFLLRNGQKYSGTWGLVGGKVEIGEEVDSALHREIKEELGGVINDCTLIPIETFISSNKKFTYHTFLIVVEEEFVPELNDEHRGYAWLPIEDHPKPLHPGVWRTIKFSELTQKLKSTVTALNL